MAPSPCEIWLLKIVQNLAHNTCILNFLSKNAHFFLPMAQHSHNYTTSSLIWQPASVSMRKSQSVSILWTCNSFPEPVISQLDMHAHGHSTAVRRMGSAQSFNFSQTTDETGLFQQSQIKFWRTLTISSPFMHVKFDCWKLSQTCFITHAYSIFSPRIDISIYPWLNILMTTRQYLSFDTLQVHLWQELSHLPCFEHAAVSLSCLKVKCTCMCRPIQLYSGAWDLHKVLISHKQHTRPVYFSSHRSNSEELWQFHDLLCMSNLTVENSPKSAS